MGKDEGGEKIVKMFRMTLPEAAESEQGREALAKATAQAWHFSLPCLNEQMLTAAYMYANKIWDRFQVMHDHNNGEECTPRCCVVGPPQTEADVVKIKVGGE